VEVPILHILESRMEQLRCLRMIHYLTLLEAGCFFCLADKRLNSKSVIGQTQLVIIFKKFKV